MNNIDTMDLVVGIVCTFLGGIFTYFAKTKQADSDKEIQFRDQTLNLAQTLQNSLLDQIEELKKENKQLKNRVEKLENDLREAKERYIIEQS